MMDNRVFNVNGRGDDMLLKALDLAFVQYGDSKCVGWRQNDSAGLILCWSASHGGVTPFPSPLNAEQCTPVVDTWLKSDFAKSVKPGERCEDYDHDGHNSKGWQVYIEGWGHVGNEQYAICAIRPAYLWHGK